jgi:hypothetical protein
MTQTDTQPAVDLDLDELVNEVTVRIGGKVFVAREGNIETQKSLIELLPDRADDDESKQATLENLELIYKQLALLLKDPKTGKPPTKKHVEEHITPVGLRKLMDRLNEAEDAPEGK